jgi:hypothetical protein
MWTVCWSLPTESFTSVVRHEALVHARGAVERPRLRGILINMTATAAPSHGHDFPVPDAERPAAAPAERRLVLLLCGTRARRRLGQDEAALLAASADADRLGRLLGHLRLTGLVGGRLMALGVAVDPRLEERIHEWTVGARELGRTHELTTLAILGELERKGVRALALKGSVLAREIYGDVGVRSAGDIDILVAPDDLAHAVEVVQRMGWAHQAVASRAAPLPVLHETLTHPSLPRVELHWRVHWYETRFSADALARAQRSAPHEPLVMRPGDGLAALILFYTRDGFAGLRIPADAAGWWDAHGDGLNIDCVTEESALRYPQLGAPLRLGTELLGALVGLPTHLQAGSFRLRAAAELATPFEEVTAADARAKVGLVDLLVAPRRGIRASLRRERQKIPAGMERPLSRHDDLSAHLARCEHQLRMLRRWAMAIGPAAARAGRSGSAVGPDLVERVSA